MLQINQIEKPRCSATIDQIRLRRAINLPFESQNFSFSGSQSVIHVGFKSLAEDFAIVSSLLLCARLVRSPFFLSCQQKSRRPEARHCAFPRTAALQLARRWTRSAHTGWRLLSSSIQVPCQPKQKGIICRFYKYLKEPPRSGISGQDCESLLTSGAVCRIYVQRNISGRP